MIGASTAPAACCSYKLEISIDATRERVWQAIFEETGSWWLPNFHVVDPDSTISFDPRPGGQGLIEKSDQGAELQWYTAQMYLPQQFKIYLVGHIAPEWGGPSTSNLMLAVEETESGCVLKVSDARHGNVDEKHLQSNQDGWKQLFTDGLKAHVENKLGRS